VVNTKEDISSKGYNVFDHSPAYTSPRPTLKTTKNRENRILIS
jgi:hypothetical protein